MIAAKLFITFFIAPGNAERGNHSPRICFVFVREQEIDAALVELGIVRSGRQRKPLGCPLPLPDESLPRLLERNTQRLRQRTECVVLGSAERQGNREFATIGKIEAACQSDIAVKGGVVLPIKAIIVRQIRPAVIYPNVTAGTICKRNCGSNHQPGIAFVGGQNSLAFQPKYLSVVVPASDLQVWCA